MPTSILSFVLLELTMEEILVGIPHDFAALVVYLLLALFVGFIWYGSRGRAAPAQGTGPSESPPQL
jgi:hypothetical protein